VNDYVHSVEEIQALKAQAATMTTTCPACGCSGRKVMEQIKQATRQEPAIFLGFEGYCVDCQLGGLPVDHAQLMLLGP
jgi:hypothetical protein